MRIDPGKWMPGVGGIIGGKPGKEKTLTKACNSGNIGSVQRLYLVGIHNVSKGG